jgi:hypothetical protein
VNRRELLKRSAAFGFVAGIPFAAGKLFAGATPTNTENGTEKDRAADRSNLLVPLPMALSPLPL